jgi:hypothetical protein
VTPSAALRGDLFEALGVSFSSKSISAPWLVVDVVDIGEIRELAWRQRGFRREEAPAPRLRREPREQRRQGITVSRAQAAKRQARAVGQRQRGETFVRSHAVPASSRY